MSTCQNINGEGSNVRCGRSWRVSKHSEPLSSKQSVHSTAAQNASRSSGLHGRRCTVSCDIFGDQLPRSTSAVKPASMQASKTLQNLTKTFYLSSPRVWHTRPWEECRGRAAPPQPAVQKCGGSTKAAVQMSGTCAAACKQHMRSPVSRPCP